MTQVFTVQTELNSKKTRAAHSFRTHAESIPRVQLPPGGHLAAAETGSQPSMFAVGQL